MTWDQIKQTGRFERVFTLAFHYGVIAATMPLLYLKCIFKYEFSWWWLGLPYAIYFPLWTSFVVGICSAKHDVWNRQCKDK